MKKLMALLSSITMLSALGVSANAEGYSIGDVDMDGVITAHDAAVISRYFNAGDIEFSDEQISLADYNSDGSVDEADAQDIIESADSILGDMDGNGKLEMMDFAAVLKLCAGYITEPAAPEQIAKADVDADGLITINDYALLSQFCTVTDASHTVDFKGSYFHWNADNMLIATRIPLKPCVIFPEDAKQMNFFGDVNGDGCLNELDAEYITNYLAAGTFPDGIHIAEADINIDGVIDQNDIDVILADPSYLVSDVNKDCYVDLTDAVETLSYYAEAGASVLLTQMAEESVYEVNNDGKVDLSDAVAVLSEYAMNGAGITG